ncbi:MAG: isoprenyl transferase [Bacillota bacterium]
MKRMSEAELKNLGLAPELPRHVAVIMDGNGRWAGARALPRTLGHRAGVERLRGIIRLSSDIGVEALSIYAFSTENWKRPSLEVNALFELFAEYFLREIDALHKNGVCIRALGDIASLPKKVEEGARAAMERTRDNPGLKLNIGLNYGGRSEIVRAVQRIARSAASGELSPDAIDEALLGTMLDTGGLPDPDLLIRTGGEKRLSNFLLYQLAYAELLFVDDYWPDFSDERYLECLRAYQSRKRRYGGL